MKIKTKQLLQSILIREHIMLAVKMALVVGTVLNCINQGECLINQEFDQIVWPKLLITYTVPFFVSLYSTSVVKLRN